MEKLLQYRVTLVIVAVYSAVGFLGCVTGQEICNDGERYSPHPECKFYWDCNSGGDPILRQCPADLFWDVAITACNLAENVPECVGGTRPPITNTTIPATTGPTMTTRATTTPSTTTIRPTTTTRRPTAAPCTTPCCIDDVHDGLSGPLNLTFHPIVQLDEGSEYSNLYTHGVSTLELDCRFPIPAGTGQITRRAGDYHFQGDYDIQGYLDLNPFSSSCLPSGNFSGTGVVTFSVENLYWLVGTTQFTDIISGRVSIRTLTIHEISFDRIYRDLGPNFRINGNPVNWEVFNANLHACFHTQLNQYRGEIETKLMSALNDRYERFTIIEVAEFLFDRNCAPCSIV
ncbi:uncharacterized protein LOC110861104 [Folsomia candida]|uniref:Chondroitin proteoglycan 1 n=1 Tax=Folsomia candida TaxID=158441 RepID=A0A226D629_FOLCA|nr:uncharacterized protein LOC110861104 [Folsomia candida]OXA39716.1 Chondroitin proteoglycan 1 [Folsomia candida]